MPHVFYIRDHWRDNSIQETGEIHRVKYDHHEKTVEILDHEDPTYEIAAREFGYTVDSECLNFRQLVTDSGIVKALTSMKIFPGSILIRFAAAWAKNMARKFDDQVRHNEVFADGSPFTAVGALDLTIKYLERYIDPKQPMPDLDVLDDHTNFSIEDDISEMIPMDIIWRLTEGYGNKDDVRLNTLYAIQDLIMACAWYPPIGRHANMSSEVRDKVVESVNGTFTAINTWYREKEKNFPDDELFILMARVASFQKMLSMAANITKKYKQEL